MLAWLVRTARRRGRLAPLVAVALSLPTVLAPLFADDLLHRLVLEGETFGLSSRPWSLYDFIPRDPTRVQAIIDAYRLPWWTDPELALNFFRPLTSATIALDHWIAPWNAPVAHVHSLLWGALLVAAVGRLHRVLVPDQAGLSTMLYALATALTLSMGWPSARHVLIGGVLTAVALERWLLADAGGPSAGRDRASGTAAFVLGLLASEGVAAAPLMYAALALRGGSSEASVARRARAPIVVLVAYVTVYVAFGQGARGSAAYLDPIHDPLGALGAIVLRVLAFTAECASSVPCDAAHGRALFFMAAGGALVLVAGAHVARSAGHPRLWGCLALAALLGSLPGSLGFYGGRVLLGSLMCTTALAALVIEHGAATSGMPRRIAGLLVLTLVALAVLFRVVGAAGIVAMAFGARDAARRGYEACPVEAERIVLGASDPAVATYTPIYWLADGAPRTTRIRVLTMAPVALSVRRTGARAIRLTPRSGAFFESDWERLYRRDMPAALDVRLPDVSVRYAAAERAIDFEITSDVRWEAACFLRWDGRRLVRVSLPELGAELAIPWHRGPMGL